MRGCNGMDYWRSTGRIRPELLSMCPKYLFWTQFRARHFDVYIHWRDDHVRWKVLAHCRGCAGDRPPQNHIPTVSEVAAGKISLSGGSHLRTCSGIWALSRRGDPRNRENEIMTRVGMLRQAAVASADRDDYWKCVTIASSIASSLTRSLRRAPNIPLQEENSEGKSCISTSGC